MPEIDKIQAPFNYRHQLCTTAVREIGSKDLYLLSSIQVYKINLEEKRTEIYQLYSKWKKKGNLINKVISNKTLWRKSTEYIYIQDQYLIFSFKKGAKVRTSERKTRNKEWQPKGRESKTGDISIKIQTDIKFFN